MLWLLGGLAALTLCASCGVDRTGLQVGNTQPEIKPNIEGDGNHTKITDSDPWTFGIALGAVVAVVAITYGVGHVHGDRGRRLQALRRKGVL